MMMTLFRRGMVSSSSTRNGCHHELMKMSKHPMSSGGEGSETADASVSKIRMVKRSVWLGLFGSTLLVALYVKRKKRDRMAGVMSQTTRLPDPPFLQGARNPMPLYSFKGYSLPSMVLNLVPDLEQFQFRSDDVVLISYPKTGTTWLQEIIWLLMHNLDFEGAKHHNITDRFPYMEHPNPGLRWIQREMPSPRLIKTHLAPSLLSLHHDPTSNQTDERVRPKVISIERDPKDTLISYYYFARMNTLISFSGSFADFFDLFVQDRVPYSPIGSIYQEMDELSAHPNWSDRVLILRYEDLKTNFEEQINKMNHFLGQPDLTPDQMQRLKDHCSFEQMSLNPSVNYSHWDDLGLRKKGETPFMRKGVTGDWKNHFSIQQKDRFDQFIQKNPCLKGYSST